MKGCEYIEHLLILKITFLISLFVTVNAIFTSLRGKFNKDILEAKNIAVSKNGAIGRLFEHLNIQYKNSSIYKWVDNYLLKAGNPLNLTPASYFVFKIVLTVLIPVYAYMNYRDLWMTFLGLITGLFVIDIIILIEKKSRKEQILEDLPDVVDSLRIQVSSGVPLASAVQELYKIPRNKSFSKRLERLSATYSITKNMETAVEDFKKHFDMVEIEGLCLTFQQNETTGSSLGLLENQSQILQANYIFKIQKDTKKKEYIVIFSMILILINIASIILYPIISQINQSLKSIFS